MELNRNIRIRWKQPVYLIINESFYSLNKMMRYQDFSRVKVLIFQNVLSRILEHTFLLGNIAHGTMKNPLCILYLK